MDEVEIPAGSIFTCERSGCGNPVRLHKDFTRPYNQFRCAICLGLPYVESGKKLIPGGFARCIHCTCQFKVPINYKGRIPYCNTCRYYEDYYMYKRY